MSTTRLLRPLPAQLSTSRHAKPTERALSTRLYARAFSSGTRTRFLPNPFAFTSNGSGQAPELLTASRTLPYSASAIYRIIADIESYPHFLPYCLDARITQWSRPDSNPAWSQRWPSQADLVIGWRDLRESFTSRLVCVPPVVESRQPGIVEATSGTAVSLVPKERALHSDWSGGRLETNGKGVEAVGMGGGSLEFLRTEWAVEDASAMETVRRGESTRETAFGSDVAATVRFRIEYKFSNVLYAAMGQAVVPKLADRMVAAFETRVHQLLGKKA